MADEKLTFLTEVELPPFCFLSEAVEWVAFGRVPQMQHHSDGSTDESVDYRFFWREMPDNFQPSFEYPWFDRLEFESLGVPFPEDYFRAAEKCAFVSVDGLPKKIAEYEANEPSFVEGNDGSTFDLWKKLADDLREELGELRPLQELVDTVESGFRPHREIAWAKLFQLLIKGEIQSQAIESERWSQLADKGDYKAAAKFEDIPPDAFSLYFDWMENEIVVKGRRHVALRVKTADILKHRSSLLQSGKSITVERFGAFYISGNASRSSVRSKRGRKTVVDWSKMKSHLKQLSLSNELPDGKESCIYALISFAEKELGRSPSRTAVQRNMESDLDALYAQN